MTLNFWSFLLFLGVSQGFFLSAALPFSKKGNEKAALFLSGLILVLTLHLLSYLSVSSGLYTEFPYLIFSFQPLLFLIGPLYYFYIRFLTDGETKLSTLDLLHLLPTVAATVYQWSFITESREYKISVGDYVLQAEAMSIGLDSFIYFSLLNLLSIAYIVYAHQLIPKESDQVSGGFEKARWLKVLSKFFTVYWIFATIALTILYISESFTEVTDYLVFLTQAVIIHAIGYVNLKYPGVISGLQVKIYDPKVRYEGSSLSKEELSRLYMELDKQMNSQKLFLNQDFKLSDLAKEVGESQHLISQVINQQAGTNFSDWVNGYRVKEAIQLSKDPKFKNYTLLALAFEAGFNSKTSFNRAFKKHTGQTPSAHLQQAQASKS